jgi:hypothetical protein
VVDCFWGDEGFIFSAWSCLRSARACLRSLVSEVIIESMLLRPPVGLVAARMRRSEVWASRVSETSKRRAFASLQNRKYLHSIGPKADAPSASRTIRRVRQVFSFGSLLKLFVLIPCFGSAVLPLTPGSLPPRERENGRPRLCNESHCICQIVEAACFRARISRTGKPGTARRRSSRASCHRAFSEAGERLNDGPGERGDTSPRLKRRHVCAVQSSRG